MKVKMLRDYDHRISPAVTQAFKAGKQVDIPKATATAMIKAGAAEVVSSDKPTPPKKD